jgi:hypothetical protein
MFLTNDLEKNDAQSSWSYLQVFHQPQIQLCKEVYLINNKTVSLII